MGIVLDLTKSALSHPSEEALEEYAFHRLPETLAAPIEEHLLICHGCQDAVAQTDLFVSAMKAGSRHPAVAISEARTHWLSRLAASRTALAPILILTLLTFLAVRKHPQESYAPVAVSLSALRGSDPLAPAPAGKPLLLKIQSPDLAARNDYRLELVDAAGNQVWAGAVRGTGGELVATMPKPLGKGVYWVRLYGAGSELLREFGLSPK